MHKLGDMYTHVEDMKFLQLNLWVGGLSIDDNTNANAGDEDAGQRRTIHDYIGPYVYKPNEPKSINL